MTHNFKVGDLVSAKRRIPCLTVVTEYHLEVDWNDIRNNVMFGSLHHSWFTHISPLELLAREAE